MLHILLTILKIIGLVLLIILALILTIILFVLFVPIRYRIKGQKEDTTIWGRARVSWFFGLIAFIVQYKEKAVEMQIKVLGFNIMKLLKKEKTPKKIKSRPKEDMIKKESGDSGNKKSESKIADDSFTPNSVEITDDSDNSEKSDTSNNKKKISIIEKIKNLINNLKERIKKIKLTILNICDKIRYWKAFVSDQRVKNAISLVKNHIFKLIKHILPRRIKGNLIYGFDDPCKTGQILAGLSVFYPVYYKSLHIVPDFSGAVLNGNLDIKGRIYLGYFVKSVLQIFFNKNIQFIIHTFRNKEES